MKTLLLTGFEPFLDHPINPSEQIVRDLAGEQMGDYRIVGRILPVAFARSGEELVGHFQELQPDAVISLGMAAGRDRITPERVAINCNDGEKDNQGVVLQDQPIVADGPDAYFSTLPIRAMVERLQAEELPAQISNTAGTYLCNHVMYRMLHELHHQKREVPSGFIHIPASHALAAKSERVLPSWSQASLTEAIRLCIDVLARS